MFNTQGKKLPLNESKSQSLKTNWFKKLTILINNLASDQYKT